MGKNTNKRYGYIEHQFSVVLLLSSEEFIWASNLYFRMFKEKFRVFLGQETFIFDFPQSSRRRNAQIHEIENIFMHPDYRSRTSENDIALLELKNEITFNSDVKAICLPGTRAKRYIDDLAVAVGIPQIYNRLQLY